MESLSRYLKTEHLNLERTEVLSQSVTVLLGVSEEIAALLKELRIATVFDLASSRLFNNARLILVSYETAGSTFERMGAIPSDVIDDAYQKTPLSELIQADVTVLNGIGDNYADDVKQLLNVKTIRDFALWSPFNAATDLLRHIIVGSNSALPDPETPPDLIPQSGDYPTEKVFYSVMVLDEIVRDKAQRLREIDAPIDITALSQGEYGFDKPAYGAIITYEQSWFAQGIALGNILHSVALAPGESTKIAMINWARLDSSSLTEEISATEQLMNATTQARSINEVTKAVAAEAQDGFSKATNRNRASSSSQARTESDTGAGGGGFGLAVGPVVVGGAGGYSNTTVNARTSNRASSFAEAVSVSSSSGRRDLAAAMAQNITNSTQQIASSLRAQRASIIAETVQTENETLTTRVITNYNHMHALSIQYYEIVQAFKVITQVSQVEKLIFIPLQIINEWTENLVKRFRFVLADFALTSAIRNTLLSKPDTLILLPSVIVEDPVKAFPPKPIETADTGKIPFDIVTMAQEHFYRTQLQTRQVIAEDIQGPFVLPNDGRKINHFSFLTLSESPKYANEEPWKRFVLKKINGDELILTREMIQHDGVGTFSAFHLNSVIKGICNVGVLPYQIVFNMHWERTERLEDISTIILEYDAPLAKGTHLWLRIGFKSEGFTTGYDTVEPFQLDYVKETGPKDYFLVLFVKVDDSNSTTNADDNVTSVTMFSIEEAIGKREFFNHFAENAIHYSRALWTNMDSTIRARLLSSYQVSGKLLAEQIDGTPLGFYANYLIFRMNVDQDPDASEFQKWEKWKTEHGFNENNVTKQEIVSIPSGGVFAEAVLGRSNSAEKLDMTRFWDWQDSPIPFAAPDIGAINAGSRYQNVQAEHGELPLPVVNIVNPQPAPDPTGMNSIINALTASSMFRDMSGLAETIGLAQSGLQSAFNAATATGDQASANGYMATMANLAAFQATLSTAQGFAGLAAGQGAPGKKNISTAGAAINQAQKIDAKKKAQLPMGNGLTESATTGGTGESRGSGSSGSSSSRPSSFLYGGQPTFADGYSSVEERTHAQIMGAAQPMLATYPTSPYIQPKEPVSDILDWENIRTTIADLAISEEAKWTKQDGSRYIETDTAMQSTLKEYWIATGLGGSVDSLIDNRTAWSAAFISWCVRTAGVPEGRGFIFSGNHISYIVGALRHRFSGNLQNRFWLFDIGEVAPRIGDIVCSVRGDADWTFSSLMNDYWGEAGIRANVPVQFASSHCDIVTKINATSIVVTGGNVGDSVSNTIIKTDDHNLIVTPAGSMRRAIIRILSELEVAGYSSPAIYT
ncbi:MAG: DUF2272 domain-containing protein [Anaerolineales bacterium]|nr:DUF2272 domain-containing protein [Anaerolineales bacterium]